MTQPRLHPASTLPLICFSGLLPLLGACNGDAMSVGDNGSIVDQPGACGDGIVQGPIQIRDQAGADALLDCELIEGDLDIAASEETGEFDLRALASLRQVGGYLRISGLGSLQGLEGLEQVGALDLQNLGVSDLRSLSSLRRAIWEPAAAGTGGGISIFSCPNLQSLEGLEQLASWSSLSIGSCPALESLRGLSGPALAEELLLYELPALRDLSGLEFLRGLERSVVINGTGIENLTGFGLRGTEVLSLVGNPNLTSLGMRRLAVAHTLSIDDNDSLVDAQLPGLEQAYYIQIANNAALRSVPRYSLNTRESLQYGPDLDTVVARPYIFDVNNNAALETIDAPDGFEIVEGIAIWNNPVLLSVNLGLLTSADELQLQNNPRLSQLAATRLQTVDELTVVNNPGLSTAAFAGVRSYSVQMSGNLDSPAP